MDAFVKRARKMKEAKKRGGQRSLRVNSASSQQKGKSEFDIYDDEENKGVVGTPELKYVEAPEN